MQNRPDHLVNISSINKPKQYNTAPKKKLVNLLNRRAIRAATYYK